jgi:hypothetical protein
MGRPPLYPEKILVQFVPGTLERLAGVLREDEDRATFIREAVAREIQRRLPSRKKSAAKPQVAAKAAARTSSTL